MATRWHCVPWFWFVSWSHMIRGSRQCDHLKRNMLVIEIFQLCPFSHFVLWASPWDHTLLYTPQERIRTYMNRIKEITDKKKASRLDKHAASRFVRNALWVGEDTIDKDVVAQQAKQRKLSWGTILQNCTVHMHRMCLYHWCDFSNHCATFFS